MSKEISLITLFNLEEIASHRKTAQILLEDFIGTFQCLAETGEYDKHQRMAIFIRTNRWIKDPNIIRYFTESGITEPAMFAKIMDTANQMLFAEHFTLLGCYSSSNRFSKEQSARTNRILKGLLEESSMAALRNSAAAYQVDMVAWAGILRHNSHYARDGGLVGFSLKNSPIKRYIPKII